MSDGVIRAHLVNWTPNPLDTLWYLWKLCREKDTFEGSVRRTTQVASEISEQLRGEQIKFFKQLIFDFSALPEFVVFNWYIEGPRALLAQITRHRHFSFLSQSFRQYGRSEEVFTPNSIAEDIYAYRAYLNTIHQSLTAYDYLRERGVNGQTARGVLSLHSMTGFVVSTNLRALAEVVIRRMCWVAQKDYWEPLLESMQAELVAKVDPVLSFIFQRYCDVRNHCLSPLEQDLRAKGLEPNAVCPIYGSVPKSRTQKLAWGAAGDG